MTVVLLGWLGTVLQITGSILNVMKKPICFIIWTISNFILIGMNIGIGQYSQIFLWGFFVLLNTYGFIKWHKENPKKEKKNGKI